MRRDVGYFHAKDEVAGSNPAQSGRKAGQVAQSARARKHTNTRQVP
ncbi:hypothetical protein L3Y19_gp090 [Gordonia phage Neville]|uniref:Uncharacterized protein n=2 Tax=Nevillevirus TaxID=3044773 RepID=A0A515MH44_9CAUD|nr:hypothetical protein L3Y19_gp090 [Gordonia phage Neville]YP_010246078.1 hypothetical protein L3Y20_gp093 [Gordonia phage Trax]AXQ64497.1 hypothetical protein SEA_NEVILLE_90 [Gordonia phage Neville]QDM55980.1 hypothetical protein SEA_TRAX_93 [Gordonia phage Trax]